MDGSGCVICRSAAETSFCKSCDIWVESKNFGVILKKITKINNENPYSERERNALYEVLRRDMHEANYARRKNDLTRVIDDGKRSREELTAKFAAEEQMMPYFEMRLTVLTQTFIAMVDQVAAQSASALLGGQKIDPVIAKAQVETLMVFKEEMQRFADKVHEQKASMARTQRTLYELSHTISRDREALRVLQTKKISDADQSVLEQLEQFFTR